MNTPLGSSCPAFMVYGGPHWQPRAGGGAIGLFMSPSASSTGAVVLNTGAWLAAPMLGFLHRAPSCRRTPSYAGKAALDAELSAHEAVTILTQLCQVCTSPGFIHPR